MPVEWIRCEERLPGESGFYWVRLPVPWDEDEIPGPELAEWYADMGVWGLLGLSQLIHADDESFPVYWARAELPEPPTEEAAEGAGLRMPDGAAS